MYSRTLRALTVATALAASAGAGAWTPTAPLAMGLPAPARDLAFGTFDGAPRILAVGEAGTWLLDPGSGLVVAGRVEGGRAVLLRDHDGDGRLDALVCGPRGVELLLVSARSLGAPSPVADGPCETFAFRWTDEGAADLLVVGDGVHAWRDGVARDLGIDPPEEPLLAVAGPKVAVSGRGAREVVEQSAWGLSRYATTGDVGGLVGIGRTFTWSLPAEALVEDAVRSRTPVAPQPGALSVADLEGDGRTSLLVAHPSEIGIVANGEEWLVPIGEPVRSVLPADVDGDGCTDLVVALESAGLTLLRGRCASEVVRAVPSRGEYVAPSLPRRAIVGPVPPPVDAEAPPAPAREVVAVLDGRDTRLDLAVGEAVEVRFVDPVRDHTEFSGSGGPVGFFVQPDGTVFYMPAVEDVGEYRLKVRLWGGLDVVRTETVWIGVHLPGARPATRPAGIEGDTLLLDRDWPAVRVRVGEEVRFRLVDPAGTTERWVGRGGPPGLTVASDGWVTYQPRAGHAGEWHVDLRMVRERGSADNGLRLWVDLGSPEVADDANRSIRSARRAPVAGEPGWFDIRTCMLSAGLAGGFSVSSGGAWFDEEQSSYYSVSPAAAAVCEGGQERGIRWFFGVDTAPIYAYVTGLGGLGQHALAGTGGLSFGTDHVRLGGFGTAGLVLAGAGLRGTWLPFTNRLGQEHGFEVRATWIASGAPTAQVMLLYGWRLGTFR